MRQFPLPSPVRPLLAALLLGAAVQAAAQTPDLTSALRWRQIGPVRAGRARALSGVPSQPNVFYAGFDNGGVWRSTDYGSNWVPLFDDQPTGSIGAIAVAPSDPNVIYVGSGAGIIRPDLATGDGVYKSTDAGKSWQHLGLRESQMIAMIDVDPKNPDRLFVAVLGHPYGPNAERGIFRSTDGGKSFEKVLYTDEYTSGNDVRIDPSDPNTVYATLWQQQQSYIEGQGFAGAGNGIFQSTDGGSTWKQLSAGLPAVIQANIALAPSNPRVLYAMAAGAASDGSTGRGGTGTVGFYRSADGGASWRSATTAAADPRPLGRIGGGDLPTIVVDPRDENVVYSSSTVFWRTEDAGATWSAVRGAPGGDDYQKTWINPNNPDIILAVADQGAVVSANRGLSWSNWYNQPTAAMYHVSTDNAFPYRVCGGQQDSGSACVDSRSNDGEITFHDWHPVNIQEYGIAAPDPKDPDKVFGSMRSGVSLYDRHTGQTRLVGPDMSAKGPNGESFNRNVRTMPIAWSPLDANTMWYVSNAVWKTTDRGDTWTRISGDLTRQTWAVPASVGKYASTVTPGPQGSITAMSPSARDARVLWIGTDDGYIQTTSNGGGSWRNVTPAAVKPWARVFNIEAGHFDVGTAYAAVNTMRLDDLNPHFFRTHDGGKTWSEINRGIAGGAVSNAIREDPRVKGLLYASTDAQVWVSYDDGDSWQSLRRNMPAISVRDLQVKDDSSCLCSDLIAGTHGRGYWILDDVTPLRQIAAARAALASRKPVLFKPATAVRVRFGTNDPTPWPPELPAGENPPPGALIDYYLPAGVSGPVALDVLDASGKLVRSYSSADALLSPDPAVDPAGYDRVCQKTPSATACGLPLYWPAPQQPLMTTAGAHRFSWDLHFEPLGEEDPANQGDEEATGAVPHRTYPLVNAPWAPAGSYTVRLTAGGVTATQPLVLKMDPRVKTPASGLAALANMSRELYDKALAAHVAADSARALGARLDAGSSLRVQLDSLAPARVRGGRGGRRAGAPASQSSLDAASAALLAAAMNMQAADAAPTAGDRAAADRAKAGYEAAMKRWGVLEREGRTLKR